MTLLNGFAPLIIAGIAVLGLRRIRVPASEMLVGLVVAAAVVLLLEVGPVPGWVSLVGQFLIGATIGTRLAAADFAPALRQLPAFVVAVMLVVAVGAAGAFVLARFTTLDLTSALLAVLPGGAPDAAAVATAVEANAAAVAAVHIMRQVIVLAVVVGLLDRFLMRRTG